MARNRIVLLLAGVLCLGVLPGAGFPGPGGGDSPASFRKPVSFSLLQDYPKGEPLGEVEKDFALMKELGIDTWRGSISWIDYEPSRGKRDFGWLHAFAELAERHEVSLRPYIGYTPGWASGGGRPGSLDNVFWNDPPARLADWVAFVRAVVSEMRRHPNVLSYEIYNEENVAQWWDGTAQEYGKVLREAAGAVRTADPDAEVLMGGLVFPDDDWVRDTCGTLGDVSRIDVVPFHAYPETWTPDNVVVENYLSAQYRDAFLPAVDGSCGRKPVWINEMGFATVPGRSERDQANWWARAVSTFLSDERVEHIGVYQIKDVRPEREVIGGGENYHLGLIHVDRTKKLAFDTVALLVRLLDTGVLTVADPEAEVAVKDGRQGRVFRHLFVRPDGRQVLFLWDRGGDPLLSVQLARPGSAAIEHALDGTPSPYPAFDGRTLRDVRLAPGEVRIFEILP